MEDSFEQIPKRRGVNQRTRQKRTAGTGVDRSTGDSALGSRSGYKHDHDEYNPDNLEEKSPPAPYVPRNQNIRYPNYEPIDFSNQLLQDTSLASEQDLYDSLFEQFEQSISRNVQITFYDDDEDVKYILLRTLKESIVTLADNKTDLPLLSQLNQVLYRCTLALDEPTNLKNIEQLAILSRELPGRVRNVVRVPMFALTGLLVAFCAISIVVGILAIPATGGGSLLISAAAAAHLSGVATAIMAATTVVYGVPLAAGMGVAAAGLAGEVATGYAAVKGNKAGLFFDKGLSKETAAVAKALKKPEPDAGGEDKEDRFEHM